MQLFRQCSQLLENGTFEFKIVVTLELALLEIQMPANLFIFGFFTIKKPTPLVGNTE